jgi:hypothetical protein
VRVNHNTYYRLTAVRANDRWAAACTNQWLFYNIDASWA